MIRRPRWRRRAVVRCIKPPYFPVISHPEVTIGVKERLTGPFSAPKPSSIMVTAGAGLPLIAIWFLVYPSIAVPPKSDTYKLPFLSKAIPKGLTPASMMVMLPGASTLSRN
jgi:hypothetical protein